MGSSVGRVGGRIGGAAFTLDGTTYMLQANAGNDSLHSGPDGLDKRVFEVAGQGQDGGRSWVTLSYVSPDGGMGYPGVLTINVTYRSGWLWVAGNRGRRGRALQPRRCSPPRPAVAPPLHRTHPFTAPSWQPVRHLH